MKTLRIALAVLGGLILVLIVAAVILVNTFDPNNFKDEITAMVQERTGRSLAIEEDIKLSLFPWFAVETGGVRLSDDPAFGDRDFVSIEALSARIRVWPLLRRRIEIGRVVLDGVDLNLGIDGSGRGNWSTLLPTDAAGETAAPAANAEAPAIERLAVEAIELRNARILWHDTNGELRYLVQDLRLVTGEIHDDEPVDLSLALTVLDVASQMTAGIELEAVAARAPSFALSEAEGSVLIYDASNTERASATLSLDTAVLDGARLRAGPAEISARLIDPSFGAETLELTAAFSALDFDTATESFSIAGLTASTGGIEASVALRGNAVLSAPQLAGELQVRGATIAALFEALGLATPAELIGRDTGGFTAAASFALELTPFRITVDRFTLAALGLEASGLAARGADGAMTASIDVPIFRPGEELRSLLASRLPEDTDLSTIASMSLSAAVALPAGGDRIELSEFALTVDAASLGGRLIVTGAADTARVAGQISASGLDNTLLGALSGNRLPAALRETGIGEFRLTTAFDYTRAAGRAVFDPLELTAYGLTGSGRLTVETASNELRLSGQASVDPFSPRALLTRFGLPVPASSDPAALGRAELAASFATTGSSGSFRDIALTLDDSRITGEFSVENFGDPLYRFVLRADRIDADRYLPPKGAPGAGEDGLSAAELAEAASAGEAGAAVPGSGRRLGDVRLANAALTSTAMIGSASVGELTIGGMRFEQLATELTIGDGRAALNSVSMRLYGGDFTGGFAVDTTGEAPTVHLTGTATQLALDPLLSDMLGDSDLSGTGNFELDLAGRGETIGQAVATAAGTLNVAFREGELSGINVGRSLCKVVNSARQLPEPAAAPEITRYQVISASAVVADGMASTSDLYANTGYLELRGQGNIRLVDQTLDTSYVTRLTGPIELAGCERLNTRVDGSIPIGFTLKGQLASPDIAFDIAQLLEDLIRREIRNQAGDAVRDRLQDALRGLLE